MSVLNKFIGLRALWRFDNRWQLIFDRLIRPRADVAVYRLGEMEFLIDHDAGDHNGTRLCLISNIYTRFLPQMSLGKSISVFDLGANGGGFPLMLVQQGKRPEPLVCVEMNPNTFRRLQYNIGRNIPNRSTAINAAVCATRQQFRLSLGRGDISDSIYRSGDSAEPGKSDYTIEGYTFDDLFQRHFDAGPIDICKMDIEGAEYEVLEGSAHECLKCCRYLIVELHETSEERLRNFRERLTAAGFELVDAGEGTFPASSFTKINVSPDFPFAPGE